MQYRNLIPAPVNRASAGGWLYKHQWISCQKNKPSTSMTHATYKSKLRSVMGSFMHPWLEKWVAIGFVVVYYTGMPTHLVQELNVGTVVVEDKSSTSSLYPLQLPFFCFKEKGPRPCSI